MPRKVNDETYYTASESADYLDISRPTFYKNVQPQLQEYTFGIVRRIYYRQADLDQYRRPMGRDKRR